MVNITLIPVCDKSLTKYPTYIRNLKKTLQKFIFQKKKKLKKAKYLLILSFS